MNLFVVICSIVLSMSNVPVHLTHEQQTAVLQEAQDAYDHGVSMLASDPVGAKESFRRAADRYRLLIDDGIENGKLWYNLGNAYLQSESIGKSIAAYRSAQRYIPSDERLKANLAYARSLVNTPASRNDTSTLLQRLFYWHNRVPARTKLIAGTLMWALCWIFLAIRMMRRKPFYGFKTATVVSACIALILGISICIDIADQRIDHGVIISTEVIVRKGNGTNYAPMFQQPIHEGIEFELLEERAHWLLIELPNGATGWIQEEDAMIVSLDKQRKERHS